MLHLERLSVELTTALADLFSLTLDYSAKNNNVFFKLLRAFFF